MTKMIVLDLDGTLLNCDSKVTNTSKKYLKMLKDRGYVIVIATGRIYESINQVLEGFSFVNYVITDNGSCCYDEKGNAIFTNFISTETAKKLENISSEDCSFIDVCNKHTIYKYSNLSTDLYFIDTSKDWKYILNNSKEISHISIVMKSNDLVLSLYDKLKRDIKEVDINIMQDSFSDRKWIDIVKKGCTKYSAISTLAEYLNIENDEIISFGDGLNDIDMIKKCGVGVALKNALPLVKENAKFITKLDHNNDGVIEFLKEYLNNNQE